MENKIGLVLSGGGTKGIAEAGAIKFLEENNIFPEIIAGTSAGAIVGGLYAFGRTPEEILDFLSRFIFSIGNILLLANLDSSILIFLDCILNQLLEKSKLKI